MNNDNFMIEREDIEIAQNVSGVIGDKKSRNRAAADILAALAAKKYFQDTDADILSGLHNSACILSHLDISDIYIKDNYIDVRIYFDESEMCVPKSHFDFDILPVAYMFMKVSDDFSEGQVTGFVFPEDIATVSDADGYYAVSEDDLKSFYDVEARLNTVEDEDYTSEFEKNVYNYLDGLQIDEKHFYKTLILSKVSREYLLNTEKAFRMYSSLNTTATEEADATETVNEYVLPQAEEPLQEPETVTLLNESEDIEPLELTDAEELSLDLTENIFPEESLLVDVDPDEQNQLLENFSETGETEPLKEDEEIPIETETTENSEGIQDIQDELPESQYEELPAVDEETEEMPIIENTDNTEDPLPEYEVVEPTTEQESTPDEFDELSKFDYSTEIAPSMNSIIADEPPDTAITEEMLDVSDSITQQDADNNEPPSENQEQIETLFDNEPHSVNTSGKKKGSPITVVGFIVLACLLGYYGYTKYFAPMPNLPGQKETIKSNLSKDAVSDNKVKNNNIAMPIETVENNIIPKQDNEPASVNIPAIEQNLNASIEVSNLSVNWEVPLAYANNTTAKRYLVRIGKVLQLNLKTELLLVSSPPITNKITVEIEYDKSAKKFAISKMIDSSGVPVVDNVIKNTINRTLGMNISTNMNVFDNLQGNPILIIKL